MNNIETFSPTGHLEITKVWKDGRSELVFSDHNIIVKGMGYSLTKLFSQTDKKITDYQIRWFQVGTGTQSLVTTITNLVSPVSTYGGNPDNIVSSLVISTYTNGTIAAQQLVNIPFNFIKRIDKTSVQFGLVLGENTANNLTNPLQEIGLFMSNPNNVSPIQPMLVAYKTFPQIEKTSEFSLVFKWTITF
jgi:hypothetical protein